LRNKKTGLTDEKVNSALGTALRDFEVLIFALLTIQVVWYATVVFGRLVPDASNGRNAFVVKD